VGAENLERAVAEAIERSRPVEADLRREINGLADRRLHRAEGSPVAGSRPPRIPNPRND
jgi:hypothetical protein